MGEQNEGGKRKKEEGWWVIERQLDSDESLIPTHTQHTIWLYKVDHTLQLFVRTNPSLGMCSPPTMPVGSKSGWRATMSSGDTIDDSTPMSFNN